VTERVEAGIRRVPGLDLGQPLPESDPRLLARIRSEILASGPMPFDRFVEIALYDPEAGYYGGERKAGADVEQVPGTQPGPGREGDFLTAPEGHPIFGWAISRRLEAVWLALGRPDRFVIREHGAGSGAMAVGILDGLRRAGTPLLDKVRYQAIDVSPDARRAFERAIDAAGLASFVEPADDDPAAGAILANELLDALPVHRVEGGEDGALLERFVTTDPHGALATVLGPPSTPALAERLAAERVALQPGQPAEVCLELDTWVADAVQPLERGVLLVIDYGYPATELHAPSRGSTLRAYHRHSVHDNPLVAIGRQDLTAHVDLTALERAAVAAGLTPIRATRQADYLAELGLGELLVGLQSDPATTLESYLAARSAVVRMLDPRATGGFAVREFGRGMGA
jgi:SAM-dependent MidA family methyltransferase